MSHMEIKRVQNMSEEKGPHCSLAQTMLERYLPEAVSVHKNSAICFTKIEAPDFNNASVNDKGDIIWKRKYVSKEEMLEYFPK
jgi:hypothetical protein